MTKRPKVKKGQRTAGERVPRAQPRGEESTGYPIFSFHHADSQYCGSWSWMTDDESAVVLAALIRLSKNTWNELRSQSGPGKQGHRLHHDQDISRICQEAQDRLTSTHLDEQFGDSMFRFAISATQRLWGFRVGDIFYIVWWDRNHLVYSLE